MKGREIKNAEKINLKLMNKDYGYCGAALETARDYMPLKLMFTRTL